MNLPFFQVSGFLPFRFSQHPSPPSGAVIIVHSYASDAFGRYVADILCPRSPTTTRSQETLDQIASRGLFLNQDMLTKRLVTRTKLS